MDTSFRNAAVFPVPGSVAPPPNGMVPQYPPLPNKKSNYHLHAIYNSWESQSPIGMLFAAFQSHNLRVAPYL